jgi:hypothetical protein
MAVNLVAKFTKPGAVFSSAEEAQIDRKSLFSDDLKARMSSSYAALTESNIIIAGPTITWDQDTFMLTIVRTVTDNEEYANFYSTVGGTVRDEIEQASSGAGWTRVSFEVVQL